MKVLSCNFDKCEVKSVRVELDRYYCDAFEILIDVTSK